MGTTRKFEILFSNKYDQVNGEPETESQSKEVVESKSKEDERNEEVVPNIPRSEPRAIPVKKKSNEIKTNEIFYMPNSPYEAYEARKRTKGQQYLLFGNNTSKKIGNEDKVSHRNGLDLHRDTLHRDISPKMG